MILILFDSRYRTNWKHRTKPGINTRAYSEPFWQVQQVYNSGDYLVFVFIFYPSHKKFHDRYDFLTYKAGTKEEGKEERCINPSIVSLF